MEYVWFKKPWDYELLDSGHGNRLERFGRFFLVRPDPGAIWEPRKPESVWKKCDAQFFGAKQDEAGRWHIHNQALRAPWTIHWDTLAFQLRLTPFKHTGIFPEQAANWEWLKNRLQARGKREGKLKILNLFAYTGAATMVLAKLGCFITHVDASKPAIAWAKENQALNKLSSDSIRWILDDAIKFVHREVKRGNTYDIILLDPPAFGHSPSGKTWKFSHDLPKLLKECAQLLSPTADCVVINAYATNASSLVLNNLAEDIFKNKKHTITHGELCLSEPGDRMLSTGIVAQISFSNKK